MIRRQTGLPYRVRCRRPWCGVRLDVRQGREFEPHQDIPLDLHPQVARAARPISFRFVNQFTGGHINTIIKRLMVSLLAWSP